MNKTAPVLGAKRLKAAHSAGFQNRKTPILAQKSGVIEYYGYRDYDAASGRWTARDPIAEQGGLNLYGMVGNDAVGDIDYLGMWIGWTHKKITSDALQEKLFKGSYQGTSYHFQFDREMLGSVIDGNLKTDSDKTTKNEQEYHFCWPTKKSKTSEEAVKDYKDTLDVITKKYYTILSARSIQKSDCVEALTHIGTLTHMWQDYFGHGRQSDGVLGKSTKNPHDIANVPSSFASYGFKGNHGGLFRILNPGSRLEPGDRAKDNAERRNDSVMFTYQTTSKLISKWFEKCACHYWNMHKVRPAKPGK